MKRIKVVFQSHYKEGNKAILATMKWPGGSIRVSHPDAAGLNRVINELFILYVAKIYLRYKLVR